MPDETRRDPLRRLAVNPQTGKIDLEVLLDADRIRHLARRERKADIMRVTLVDYALSSPKAIFKGIRFEEDEQHSCDSPGWLCYCGCPPIDFRFSGDETDPPPRKVFLVFVNEDKIIYRWDWERADSDAWDEGKCLPIDYQTRFQEQII
jgi:hypothetical protein